MLLPCRVLESLRYEIEAPDSSESNSLLVLQPVVDNAGSIAGGGVGQTYIDPTHVVNSVCNVMDHVATVCNSVP